MIKTPKSRNIRALAAECLMAQEAGGGSFRDVAEGLLNEGPVDARDRNLVHEMGLGVLRNLRLLDAWIQTFSSGKRSKPEVGWLLRLAAYQALFLDRIPTHAIIAETMKAADGYGLPGPVKGFLRAVTGKLTDETKVKDGFQEFREVQPEGIRYSLPDWLVDLWHTELPAEFLESCLQSTIVRPPVWVFPTRDPGVLKTWAAVFGQEGVECETEPGIPCLRLKQWCGAVRQGLLDGKLFIQSPHQYRSVHLCPAKEGDRVLEVGAAPGGKTISLSRMVGGMGQVVALDRDGVRMKQLEERIQLLGLSQTMPLRHDVLEPLPTGLVGDGFHHAVVDAPCANLAELARRPEARHRVQVKDLELFHDLQVNILKATYPHVRSGGTLLYMTCSLTHMENRAVVDHLTGNLPLRVIDEMTTIPRPAEPAGGYACLMQKTEGRGKGREEKNFTTEYTEHTESANRHP